MARRDRFLGKIELLKKNLSYLYLVVVISFVVLILRLFYLQIIKGDYFSSLAKRNSIRLVGIAPPRGDIKTSDGVFYAKNVPSFSVYLYKSKKLTDDILLKVSKLLGVDKDDLKQKLAYSGYYKSIPIKRNVDRRDVFRLLFDQEVSPFVNIEVEPKRVYPSNAYAYANVVGYISEVSLADLRANPLLKVGDLIGRKGIEKKYDAQLRGEWGYKEVEVSSKGAVVRVISTTPPRKGKSITLTIDSRLQSFIYNKLKENNLKGAVVVERPNGAILAIVDSDTFNPNFFVEGLTRKQWKELQKSGLLDLFDMATQGAFPPGSLIKPFVALAALQEGIIKPTTVVFCPYAVKIGKYTYRDWRAGGFGYIDLYRAIESSSDVFFYQLGMKLGIDKMDYYLSKFGFGKSPGLFSYCSKGNLPSRAWKYKRYSKGWYIGDTISTSIGQGFFLATPLQVAVAFSVIANEGIGYRPFLVEGSKSFPLYVFKSRYYKDIKKALWLVVNGTYGTAGKAKIDGLNICGKTGTSQVVSSAVYKRIKKRVKEGRMPIEKAVRYYPHAWFASFAPKDNPKVIVVVFLEHGESSANAAAFARLVYEKLIELGII
ncbi:penicillin-binding protein 2 [Hippea sp. KM1]|uniref:penicillin-binding protein 2 n=1 Tax=Hippea sp. KM1 TaxID=944481 RepID=UPI00046D2138|nr:penicillin-binding protein 2 [Hippea sp. KM1]